MKSYCVSFSLSYFLQHYVLETNSGHGKLEFIRFQCCMGFHCMCIHNVFTCYSQWAFGFFSFGISREQCCSVHPCPCRLENVSEVSAERISGSRTAVSERARLSRFNVECQVVVQSDRSSVEGGVPCSGPPQDVVESKVFIFTCICLLPFAFHVV